MKSLVVAAGGLTLVALLTNCSSASDEPSPAAETVTVTAAASPSSAPTASVDSPSSEQEAAFVQELRALGSYLTNGRRELLGVGRTICGGLADGLTVSGVTARADYDPRLQLYIPSITALAATYLCPSQLGRVDVVQPPVEDPEAQPKPTREPEPAGPPSTFADGTYEAGVDVAAGVYRSTDGTPNCFVYTSSKAGDLGSLLSSNSGVNAAIEIAAGEWVKSSDCGTFKRR